MNTFLWIAQILFGLLFLAHGLMLLRQPASRRETLAQLPYSKRFLRFIGGCELLGAVGLILPWGLGIAPILTPLAAWGLAVIVLGAATTHFRQGQTPPAVATSLFALLLVTLAIGRG